MSTSPGSADATTFHGFPHETATFLTSLRENNSKEWFAAHRREYEDYYLEPAKRLVEAVGPRLRAIAPDVEAQPRILGSIFRINRDTRFGRKDAPYKDHVDVWFWEGPRRGAVSGFFARISPDFVGIGAGCHGFDKHTLAFYRRAVADDETGSELVALVDGIEALGHGIGGEHYKRYPSGFASDAPAGRFLLYKALYVHTDHPAEVATSEGLVELLMGVWTELSPLHRWLTDRVQTVRDRASN
ncbi:MAG: DUF2461 domain-containing protein [Gemmatimonadetes bacterium]|nr:DUF2461 domain-containing protein [Gemmatimonadota bacterium]